MLCLCKRIISALMLTSKNNRIPLYKQTQKGKTQIQGPINAHAFQRSVFIPSFGKLVKVNERVVSLKRLDIWINIKNKIPSFGRVALAKYSSEIHKHFSFSGFRICVSKDRLVHRRTDKGKGV